MTQSTTIVTCLLLSSVIHPSSSLWPFGRADDSQDHMVRRRARDTDTPLSATDELVRKNEDTVINTILRVVDHKFDTLSARITALERAVNGLQYYSVRQFRLLYTNTKSINSQIQDISTRVSGLEIEISRADLSGVRDKVTSIDHDVKMLFRQNNDMFEGMEQTLVVVNDNVNKGALEIKGLLEKLSTGVSERTEFNSTLHQSDDTENADGDKEIKNDDTQKSEGRPEKNSALPDVIEASPRQEDIDTFTVSKYFHKLENLIETYFNASALRDQEYHTTTVKAPAPTPSPSPTVPIAAVFEMAQEGARNLTRMINTLDGKMGDSVKFQRHAEHMLERLITNSETLAEQTIALSDNVAQLQGKIGELEEQSSKSRVRVEELQSHSLLEAKKLAEKYVKSGQLQEECKISPTLRSQIVAIVAKNASHVFDQLTELAQLSTTSLPKTVLDLHDVITKLLEVTNNYNALIAAEKADDDRKRALDEAETRRQIEETLNHTRASFNIMEAVSSNTGWLPLLLDTIDVIGMTANQTLAVTNTVLEKVEQPVQIYVQTKTSVSKSGYKSVTPRCGGSKVAEVRIDDDKLKEVYNSMEKFSRLLPTIMNTLSKSGTILNLVNGSSSTEGRLEMYHNGHWGTVCSRDMRDTDAVAICRLLGHGGGHLAQPGHFGAGQGPVWKLNTGCIDRRNRLKSDCVKNALETRSCSHEEDVGIVCDHMIRLLKQVTNMRRGTVQVFSKGTWGGVCFDGWDDPDATVACRQLGYRYGRSVNAGQVIPGTPVWLRNVRCNGKETRLDACSHTGWEWQNCYSNRLAGVQCGV